MRANRIYLWLCLGLLAVGVATVIVLVSSNQQRPIPEAAAIKVSVAQDPQSLDPAKLVDTETSPFVTAQFATLTLVNREGELVPILAESVSMSNDGKLADIRLRENGYFSDGSPITSSDVRFSLERLYSLKHPQKYVVERIVGIGDANPSTGQHAAGFRIVNARHLTIEFNTPDPLWPRLIASPFCGIVKEGSDKMPSKPIDAHLIGAGPFVLESSQIGGVYRYRKNVGFPLAPPAEKLEIQVFANEQEALSKAQSGSLDCIRLRANLLASGMQAGGKDGSQSSIPGYVVSSFPVDDLVYLLINWQHPKFSKMSQEDKFLWRHKLSKSIDKATLVSSIYKEQAVPADRAIRIGAIVEREFLGSDTFSDKQKIELMAPSIGELRQIADYVQASASNEGFEISVRLVSVADFIDRLGRSEFEIALLWLESNVPVPEIAWSSFFSEGGAASLFGDPLPEISDRVSAARTIAATAERNAALAEVVKVINFRQLRVLPLVHRKAVFLLSRNVVDPGIDANGVLHFSLLKSANTSR